MIQSDVIGKAIHKYYQTKVPQIIYWETEISEPDEMDASYFFRDWEQLPEIEKTALGATQSISWTYFENVIDAVNHLKEDNYQIIAIEQAENSISLTDYEPQTSKKYAFFFGNEVNGVSEEVMQNMDTCVEIPQFGTKHSFNIVISTGIVLWDFYSKYIKL